MPKRKINFISEYENGEKKFMHDRPEFWNNPGTYRRPTLTGVHPSNRDGFGASALSDGNNFEYVLATKTYRGERKFTDAHGNLRFRCVKRGCPGKLLLDCTNNCWHDTAHAEYDSKTFHEEKFKINNYNVVEKRNTHDINSVPVSAYSLPNLKKLLLEVGQDNKYRKRL